MTRRTSVHRARARAARGPAGTVGTRAARAAVTTTLVVLGLSGCSVQVDLAEPPLGTLAPTSESTSAPDAPVAGTGTGPRPGAPGTPTAPGATAPAAHDTGVASVVLATLPVKGKAPKTGYDRDDDFGTAWLDVDRNGCDTRNDILARDLVAIERPSRCTVLSGELVSPYTGAAIHFVRGQDTSAEVQIDHVVALANAWQTGAQQLSQAQREALANDPLNLLAVDGHSNSQKRDGDAATWLPAAKGYRCAYVARQVAVKAQYGLWVAPAEHDAIARVLDGCPGQPLPAP